MKHALMVVLMLGASLSAQALQVEFEVPVELRHIDNDATHVDVICGSFGDGRYLNSEKVSVPLRDAGGHKEYNGIVKVTVSWPGTTMPSGRYRCAMVMKTTGDYMDFTRRPAAVGSRAVTLVEGGFNDLQAAPVSKSVGNLKPVQRPVKEMLK